MVQRCYTGLEIRNGVLWINPKLPHELPLLKLSIRYRGHWIELLFTQKKVEVVFGPGWSPPVDIGIREKIYTFGEGERREFDL
jgi:trehalose/maltose hydrolase-like predicted phosphorylase